MTIIVGYKPSKAAEAALNKGLELGRLTGENVLVVNAGPGGEHRTSATMSTEQKEQLRARLADLPQPAEFREFARGRSTVEEFKDLAAELDPSYFVVGIRRRSGLKRLVMGSVADELLRELEPPIVCVKEGWVDDPTARDALES